METNREMSFKNLTWTGMSPMICKANGVKFPLQKAMCSSFSWLFNNLTTTRKLRAYTVVQMPLLPISETTKPRSTNDQLSQQTSTNSICCSWGTDRWHRLPTRVSTRNARELGASAAVHGEQEDIHW